MHAATFTDFNAVMTLPGMYQQHLLMKCPHKDVHGCAVETCRAWCEWRHSCRARCEQTRLQCCCRLTTQFSVHFQRRLDICFRDSLVLLDDLEVVVLMSHQYLVVVLCSFFQHITLQSAFHVFHSGSVDAWMHMCPCCCACT